MTVVYVRLICMRVLKRKINKTLYAGRDDFEDKITPRPS
jgi:hypothetical protein